MRLTPTADKVIVKLDPVQDFFDGEELLKRPDIAKDKPTYGEVIAVGPGKADAKGRFIPTTVFQGERVIIPWGVGCDMTINSDFCVSIKEDDILGVEE